MQQKPYNNGYNKNLRPLANQNRHNMTKAEACLWKYALRAGQMSGYPFRRQRPILDYIVDFVCLPLKLIIEVDGLSHQREDIWIKDLQRQQELEKAGFIVLRFNDAQVLTDINNVKLSIASAIQNLEESTPLPPPAGENSENR